MSTGSARWAMPVKSNREKMPKILGVIMARNEYGLISVSVSHALNTLCDEVLLLVHDSTEEFEKEVLDLASLWPGRIRLFKINQKTFRQENALNILRFMASSLDYAWIYPFDADEFPMSNDFTQIKSYLDNLNSECIAVRYKIENWVSFSDFNINSYPDFLKISELSIPMLDLDISSPMKKSEIISGNFNFFDFQFGTKVIFRNTAQFALLPGAHSLLNLPSDLETSVTEEVFKVAHLPFLSKERLQLRSEQGENLINAGFPESHGWQSQMVYQISQKGELVDFWLAHSVHSGAVMPSRTQFSSIGDSSFREAIISTVDLLKSNKSREKIEDQAFQSIDELLECVDFINIGYSSNRTHNASVILDRDIALGDWDIALAESDSHLASRMWKLFSPYRNLKDFLKRL